jgi:uncharacterized protein
MISSLYAFLLGLIFLVLTIRIIKLRRSLKISLGDGENVDLQRAIRAHGNFCEVVPFALVLIILSEVNGISPLFLHICGTTLLIGRISHAYGISQKSTFRFRIGGMFLTLTSVIISLLLNLLIYISAF